MLLEVGQLSETLLTKVALERSLAAVHSEMDLRNTRDRTEESHVHCCQMRRIFGA